MPEINYVPHHDPCRDILVDTGLKLLLIEWVFSGEYKLSKTKIIKIKKKEWITKKHLKQYTFYIQNFLINKHFKVIN